MAPPSRNNNSRSRIMNSSDGLFDHEAIQSVREIGRIQKPPSSTAGRKSKEGIDPLDIAMEIQGHSNHSQGKRRRCRSLSSARRKSEGINPLDMASGIQGHNNNHSRESQQQQFKQRNRNNNPKRQKRNPVQSVLDQLNDKKSSAAIDDLCCTDNEDDDDDVQYDDTNNWNALNGLRCSEQQNTRISSTRDRSTHGTSSSSLVQVSTNKNGSTRSARRRANRDIAGLLQESIRNTRRSRRKNKTPETIDITNSDSEDDDIVVDNIQSVEKVKNGGKGTSTAKRTKGPKGTVIIAGQVITTSNGRKGRKDDRVQYDNWNPLNGTRYSKQQQALNSTRGGAICGTSSSSLSNSDSEDDDIVVENNHSMKFVLKRLAINELVRSQHDYQPMIKYDFKSNSIFLSYNKSKVDVTKGRSEIRIAVEYVQEMTYFEMNDAAEQNGVDLVDLVSFVYLRSEARARGGKQQYHFVLEFEEDEHLRDLLEAVRESGLFIPTETRPEDIEMNAKALIEDSWKKYNLRRKATTQTTQSTNINASPVLTSNTMSQNSSFAPLSNLRKVNNCESSTERTKIPAAAQAIANSNGPKVSKEVLDLREENKRLKESEKRAKEEVKRAQDILLQAGAIIVDETNDGDDQHKPGTKATTRSLLAVQELRNNNEGLEDKVKNFEEGIDKAKKVLEQAWAIVI